uniref:Putative ribosomal protein S6 kinase alpha-1 n=1 Tax=Schistocephalus solidus TaxID=70667 RepID=A0A183S7A5_SCHSO
LGLDIEVSQKNTVLVVCPTLARFMGASIFGQQGKPIPIRFHKMHRDFNVLRFIGRGCYSLVFEARHTEGPDTDKSYALKRFFLQNSSAVNCALRERRLLEKLALEPTQSPFLPTLFYSFMVNDGPVFLLREGTGCDLFDLLHTNGLLSESQSRFYVSEIICGLEHLHSLGIVHLDLKPENVLMCPTGHVFISDFDRSYDLTQSTKRPTDDDFTGTPLFMAPEIAKGDVITTKADVWSLGVLMAEMVCGPIRPVAKDLAEDLRWAKEGRYTIRRLKSLTKPLQAFFSTCLQRKYQQRPELAVVRQLRFFKYVDWDQVRSNSLTPPISTSLLKHRPNREAICKLNPTDPLLLASAYASEMPITRKKLCQVVHNQGDSSPRLATEPPDLEDLAAASMTKDALAKMFADFTFVHPSLRRSIKPTDGSSELFSQSAKPPSSPVDENSNGLDSTISVEDPKPYLRKRNRKCSAGD